jgi:uncharacterized protein YndB with AHSA1/START domain
MTERFVVHSTFVIDRVFPAAPARVFAAWSTVKEKSRWFAGSSEWKETLREIDFRVGGRERLNGTHQGKRTSAFDALYFDIVPDERIVYTYDMYMNSARISISLATIEFKPAGTGTRLILTEQGAFLDGVDKPEHREHGTKLLMDRMGASLLE